MPYFSVCAGYLGIIQAGGALPRPALACHSAANISVGQSSGSVRNQPEIRFFRFLQTSVRTICPELLHDAPAQLAAVCSSPTFAGKQAAALQVGIRPAATPRFKRPGVGKCGSLLTVRRVNARSMPPIVVESKARQSPLRVSLLRRDGSRIARADPHNAA
jgi:hypothetical protein